MTLGIPEFTLVCGLDSKHLTQFEIVFPTWKKHKPSLINNHPMLIFYDADDNKISDTIIREKIDHPNLKCQKWPTSNIVYDGDSNSKWTNPQRYKMLAGFVHISHFVQTPFMFKLDTDAVANGVDDWIDPDWFNDSPVVVAQPWSFTKPKDQMMALDRWVKECQNHLPEFDGTEPLNLIPKPGSERVGHKRIASWCSFWDISFVRMCADMATRTCGKCKLPVPSQDGFLWYCAERLNHKILRTRMKGRGWVLRSTMYNIRAEAEKAMK